MPKRMLSLNPIVETQFEEGATTDPTQAKLWSTKGGVEQEENEGSIEIHEMESENTKDNESTNQTNIDI